MAFNGSRQLSDSEHSDSFTPRDDRFYTPRASARVGGSSSDGEWGTPRDGAFAAAAWGSDSEYVTPRNQDGHVPHWSSGHTAPAYHPNDPYYHQHHQHQHPAEAKTAESHPYHQHPSEDKWAHDAKAAYGGGGAGGGGSGGYGYSQQQEGSYPYPQRPPPHHYPQHQHQQQHQQLPSARPRPPLHPSSYPAPDPRMPTSPVQYGQPAPSPVNYGQPAPGHSFQWDLPGQAATKGGTYGPPVSGYGEGSGPEEKTMDEAVEDIFSFSRHNRVEEIERLLDSGVPVNVRDHFGNTILAIACQNGHKRVLKAALRRGADINSRNYRGNTPLHFCFRYGYGDTLGQYLISKGADPAIRNNSNLTCYEGLGH